MFRIFPGLLTSLTLNDRMERLLLLLKGVREAKQGKGQRVIASRQAQEGLGVEMVVGTVRASDLSVDRDSKHTFDIRSPRFVVPRKGPMNSSFTC